jgi:hypothetical protein
VLALVTWFGPRLYGQGLKRGRRWAQLRLEPLETRCLLAVSFTDANDRLSTAIDLGDTTRNRDVPSNIGAPRDVDLFSFKVVRAGQHVGFRLTRNRSQLKPFLRLFDSRGNDLPVDVKRPSPGVATVAYNFPATGIYYVGASARGNETYDPVTGAGDRPGDSFGADRLRIQPQGALNPRDPNDRIATAVRLDLSAGSATNRRLPIGSRLMQSAADVDMFAFQADAGQLISMDIDTPRGSPLDIGLRLFDANAAELGSNDDGTAPEEAPNLDAYLEATVPSAGTYYLGVSRFPNFFYDARSGRDDLGTDIATRFPYALAVSVGRPPVPDDENDQIAEAVSLGDLTQAAPAPVTNFFIFPETDVDMFRFTVAAGQTVSFAADPPGDSALEPQLRLFDAGGVDLPLDATARHRFVAAGTYYLGVSARGNDRYDPLSGSGDILGTSIGDYILNVTTPSAQLSDSRATTPRVLRPRRVDARAIPIKLATVGSAVRGIVFVDDSPSDGKYESIEQPVNPRGRRFVFLDRFPYDQKHKDGEPNSGRLSGLSFTIVNVTPGTYRARLFTSSSRQEYVTVPIDRTRLRNGKPAPGYYTVTIPASGNRSLTFGLVNSRT